MNFEDVIEFIEDKDFQINDSWYLHATSNNAEVVKKILEEGIKASYLRNDDSYRFNGKYYISLYRHNSPDEGLTKWLANCPKFVIKDIKPLYADRKKFNLRRIFINTRIPLRTSEWDGEYQQYLLIDTSKFVALAFDLSYIFKSDRTINENFKKEHLQLLKNIVLSMNTINYKLPIYDFYTRKEINREKVLSLNI